MCLFIIFYSVAHKIIISDFGMKILVIKIMFLDSFWFWHQMFQDFDRKLDKSGRIFVPLRKTLENVNKNEVLNKNSVYKFSFLILITNYMIIYLI